LHPSSTSPLHHQHFSSAPSTIARYLGRSVFINSITSTILYSTIRALLYLPRSGLKRGPAVGRRFDSLTPVVCEITLKSQVIITRDLTYEKPGGAPVSLIVFLDPRVDPGILALGVSLGSIETSNSEAHLIALKPIR